MKTEVTLGRKWLEQLEETNQAPVSTKEKRIVTLGVRQQQAPETCKRGLAPSETGREVRGVDHGKDLALRPPHLGFPRTPLPLGAALGVDPIPAPAYTGAPEHT